MVSHPIRLKREHYSGRDQRKRQKAADKNRVASELESYINGLLLRQVAPIEVYDFAEIADATGYSMELVSDLGYSIDGGSNGFTAWRHDLTYDAAVAAQRALAE